MSVLVVAAHPDDEVLGCGGTMARLASEGEDVHVLILGEGQTSRDGAGASGSAVVEQLASQARQAGDVLGAASVRVLDFPDNRFDRVDLLDIVKVVERAIEALTPTVVFTHHRGDLNVDHALTARAVITATRP